MWFKRKKEEEALKEIIEKERILFPNIYAIYDKIAEGIEYEEEQYVSDFQFDLLKNEIENLFKIYTPKYAIALKLPGTHVQIYSKGRMNDRQMVLEAMFNKETGMHLNSNKSLFESWKQIKGY